MIDEYLKVAAVREQRAVLEAKMPSADVVEQGAGAMGPSASTEQPAVEPSRVTPFSQKYASLELAEGLGRELARVDFEKMAARRFEKAALDLGAAGTAVKNFVLKRPGTVGAGIGAVGGAIAGGPDHRISGALGGAAVGGAAGSAGVGIGKRMMRGQDFSTAAKNYGTNMRRTFQADVEKVKRIPKIEEDARQIPMSARGRLRAKGVEGVPLPGAGRVGFEPRVQPAAPAAPAAGVQMPLPL